ncbi:hypothetical protein RR46_05320 [Papilio xuthus]|uniref:Uncharacterized protein n=1 Tax=Papilio xuthus TaxID=66420 RepID=A0A194Q7T4_PAPXU|nr:hypothetical protein RR46_05320 [Papilio xuthus]
MVVTAYLAIHPTYMSITALKSLKLCLCTAQDTGHRARAQDTAARRGGLRVRAGVAAAAWTLPAPAPASPINSLQDSCRSRALYSRARMSFDSP